VDYRDIESYSKIIGKVQVHRANERVEWRDGGIEEIVIQ